jgi:hypothetical protein
LNTSTKPFASGVESRLLAALSNATSPKIASGWWSTVRLDVSGTDAQASDAAVGHVLLEDIGRGIAVARHEIRRVALEGYRPAERRGRVRAVAAHGLCPAARRADALGDLRGALELRATEHDEPVRDDERAIVDHRAADGQRWEAFR